MTEKLSTLIEQRDSLQKQMQLLNLREAALQKRIDKVVSQLQAECQHESARVDSTYFSGGYDYCAETRYHQHCLTCGKTLQTWTKVHHGVYG